MAREEGEEGKEGGGSGHLHGDEERVPEDSDREEEDETWGNEDDLAREEERKLLEAKRTKQNQENGISMGVNLFDEYEKGTVVRSRESFFLKRIEELYGGKPWASPFVEARENIKKLRTRKAKGKAARASAVVETIRGSAPAGGITLTAFDMPHSSRQGPVRSVPISPIIGASVKKRLQARTAVGIGGIQSMIEGVSGNYPVHFSKPVDATSPFIFQGIRVAPCAVHKGLTKRTQQLPPTLIPTAPGAMRTLTSDLVLTSSTCSS